MKGRCVTQSDTIFNKSLLLTHVFVMHWILLHGLQAEKQCGEFIIVSPPLSNGVLRLVNNTEVNITFSLNNSRCEFKDINQIDISINTPVYDIFLPQCVIVIVNNSCRITSAIVYMCGCLENAWNYYFTANLSGSIRMKVSADNLSIPNLLVNLTTFKTSADFTVSSDVKRAMATHNLYHYLLLPVGISAGVVIITLTAGLIHFCTFKCDKAQNGMQIEQREYEMNNLSNEELRECVSLECVKRKMNQPDDNSCNVRCSRNKPTENCQNVEKGKPGKCLTPGYLSAVPYPEWQKDDNHQIDAEWQKDDNHQIDAEWQKDDNHQIEAEWQKDDNHQIDAEWQKDDNHQIDAEWQKDDNHQIDAEWQKDDNHQIDAEWQKDDNHQIDAEWQKDDNHQIDAEWQKDDNHQSEAEWQKDDNHQIDKHPISQQIVRNASYDHLNNL